MLRPFGAALSAVVLAGALGGVAEARSHVTPQSPPAASQPAIVANDDATAPESASAPQAESATPQAGVDVRALQTASNMPSADADLRMWSAGSLAASPNRHAAGLPAKPATATSDPIHQFARGIISRTSSLAMSLTRDAMRFIGTPYVFGGTSPSGFDCSGYTQHVFAMLGISLPRTADAQYYAGHPTVGGIQPGDLVFFQTYLPGPSHVGIYIGGGRFIHSSSHGVRISALAESYWASRYLGAKRVVAFR